jgi:pimeloyl-ACP methyl ester carboxylesterase
VIAVELGRTRPELCAGAVLIEPPMAADDHTPAAPAAFLAEFDRRAAEQGGPAAGEFFLRTVLGDAAFERMPRAFQERSKQKWAEIRADSAALIAYKPRYAELAAVAVPVLLVGGDRSASYFRPTLDALLRSLPNARLEIVSGAGHMLHAEAPRKFGELLVRFADELQIE